MTKRATLSRRQFAQNLATAGAATVLAPVLMAQSSPAPTPTPPETPPAALTAADAGKTMKKDPEVEARIAWIDEKYGSRLDETQRKDIRRLISEGQAGVLTMRAYPLDNGNQPSPVFRPYTGKGKKRS